MRGAVRDGIRYRALGGALGAVLAGWPGHQADFDLLPLHWDREQASASMYYSRAHLSFLPPCGKPHSVFKQLSEVFFLVLDPRAGMPQWDLDPMLLRDDP